MWGDPEKAVRLDDGDDYLVSVLLQVTGPAHIPWQDPVWQELLHGYNVWVHVTGDLRVLTRAAASTVQHAHRSSNLAALSLHVTRLLQEFTDTARKSNSINSQQQMNSSSAAILSTQQQEEDQVTAFSNRISLVAKARAVAGALNLLRILAHAVLQQSSTTTHSPPISSVQQRYSNSSSYRSTTPQHSANYNLVQEAFLYKSRDNNSANNDDNGVDTGADLLDAVLRFLCHVHLMTDIPELYDCVTLALQLVLVLLSTQLYQPMTSSFQKQKQQQKDNNNNNSDYNFWTILMEQANANAAVTNETAATTTTITTTNWTPRQLLTVLLDYQIHRPVAPTKSIQYHSCMLTQQVVAATKGEKVGNDGMYETHLVVTACAPTTNSNAAGTEAALDTSSSSSSPAPLVRRPSNSAILLDATRGVLVISSKIILLPIRLMTLALGLWGLHHHHGNRSGVSYDQAYKEHLQKQQKGAAKSRTRDVLWLTMSPIADLSTTVLLLLSNNERAERRRQKQQQRTTTKNGSGSDDVMSNPFRTELAGLCDNRWESDGNDLPDLLPAEQLANGDDSSSLLLMANQSLQSSSEEANPLLLGASSSSIPAFQTTNKNHNASPSTSTALTVNFEALFASFGLTAHTEPGAMMLYTLLQSSPSFAQSIAVRSDLDTLVLPLLRTLYFATSLRFHVQQDYHSSSNGGATSSNSRASMVASNVRRRSSIESFASTSTTSTTNSAAPLSIRNCPYRSQSQLYVIIILLLLFSQDPSFGADAFRRVNVPTVAWYKERYLKEISLGSVLLLSLLRALMFNLNRQHDAFLLSNCCAILMNLSPSIVDLHDHAAMRLASLTVSSIKRYLVLRKQNPDNDDDDLTTLTSMHGEASRTLLCVLKHCLCAKNIERNLHLIYALVYHQADFKRLFSGKACPFKKTEIARIQTVIAAAASLIEQDGNARTAAKALKILTDNIEVIHDAVTDRRKRAEPEDFTFTYEEEADPEIFFVPYLWEVIVCVVTSASIEWNKNNIQVFPLLEEEEEEEDEEENGEFDATNVIPQFARDVSDVV